MLNYLLSMLPVQIGDDAEQAEEAEETQEAERSGDPWRQEICGRPIAHQNPDGCWVHCRDTTSPESMWRSTGQRSLVMNGRPCCAVLCCAVLPSLRRCR